MEYTIICKPFRELTPDELYAIVRLRIEVFIIEQKCIFQDLDNKDQHCLHLMYYHNGVLAAYARLVPRDLSYQGMLSIGRVITSPQFRGTGAGRVLMERAVQLVREHYGAAPIRIGAQLYAKAFYERIGFRQSSGVYDEDGIDHILMDYPPETLL
jgi:ElaA protein